MNLAASEFAAAPEGDDERLRADVDRIIAAELPQDETYMALYELSIALDGPAHIRLAHEISRYSQLINLQMFKELTAHLEQAGQKLADVSKVRRYG